MVLGYVLLVLLPLAAIAYIVWDHRRKSAQREAGSTERLHEMLDAVQQVRAEQNANGSTESTVGKAGESSPARDYVRRERVLDPRQTLLYYLLRTALPDYVILAQVPLSAALEPSPSLSAYTREECSQRLGSRAVDFLVCERSMRPVAAIQLIVAANALATASAPPQSWLTAAGVRYLELDPTALPRKDAIRTIVLGADAVAVRAEQDITTSAS